VIQHVDSPPGANAKVTARSQSIAAGGPATNPAANFAALGGTATLITALGRGAAADLIRADLARNGVHVVDATPRAVDKVPVSSITVVALTGERSVVSTDASGIAIATLPDLDGAIGGADVVLVDGHHPSLAVAAARLARKESVPLVVDAGRWRPIMAELVPLSAAVVCSADFRFAGTASVAESAQALVEQGVPTVVITRGADPVLWWHGGEHGAVDPPAVPAVDTTGAGDVFHGAYCYFRAMRGALRPAGLIDAASKIAALSCRYAGTRSWLEHLDDETAT
jgi:sugar/nucleoside kinase (ribokinase family)